MSNLRVINYDSKNTIEYIPKVIGEGKFGQVFRATSDEYGLVALKIIDLQGHHNMKQIVAREMEVFGETTNMAYNVVPLKLLYSIDGVDMGVYIRGEHKQTNVVHTYMAQLLLGLRELHDSDILHRDIKPENVMISKSGKPFYIDFGFSCRATKAPKVPMGTPNYMAPESWTGIQTTANDVWALGATFLELITNKRPYDLIGNGREHMKDLVSDVIKMGALKPALAGILNGSIYKDLILGMLEIDPAKRYTLAKAIDAINQVNIG
jgi:serine/threonine protein kinase